MFLLGGRCGIAPPFAAVPLTTCFAMSVLFSEKTFEDPKILSCATPRELSPKIRRILGELERLLESARNLA
jgi:hypothetical protein